MNRLHCLLLAGTLVASGASAEAQTGQGVGQGMSGGQRSLITPIVPGPPTYEAKPSQARKGDEKLCESPGENYLDPRVVARKPPLDPAALYTGWLARSLIGEDVVDREGHDLGEVRDILVGSDGHIAALLIEEDALLDFSGGAFRAPWNHVVMTPKQDGVMIGLSAKEARQLGLIESAEPGQQLAGQQREFRVAEILGDWTRIGNETDPCSIRRGYVRDVVFDRSGQLTAILEARSSRIGGGTYAYPFYDYQAGWRPFYGYYDLPFENMSKPAPKVELGRFGNV